MFLWMRALSANKIPMKPRLARLLSAGLTGSATTPSFELLFSVDLELASPYVAMLLSLTLNSPILLPHPSEYLEV